MTLALLEEWLLELDKKFKNENKNIILFLDNATSHSKNVENRLSNIKVIFFPPNTTSVLQPLDQGIIQSFKLLYRKMLVKKILQEVDVGVNDTRYYSNQINVYEAIEMISNA